MSKEERSPDGEQVEPDLEITDLQTRQARTMYPAQNRPYVNPRTVWWVVLAVSSAVLIAVLLNALPGVRDMLGQLAATSATPTARASSDISGGSISVIPPFSTALPTVPTATSAPAPTPTDVPAGWTVLVGSHFSLAYPPGWILQTPSSNSGALIYNLEPLNPQNQGVQVEIFLLPPSATSADMAPYCLPPNSGIQQTRLAGLPMAYELAGEGLFMRTWTFVNSQPTEYWLDALDEQGTAAVQAQDVSILATFRPDDSTPWQC